MINNLARACMGAAVLLMITCRIGTAAAEVVALKGANSSGQGWRFLDNDGKCKIVTAGHVVNMPTGIVRVQIADVGGVWTPTGWPYFVSQDVDIAILPIPAMTASTCGNGRLSPIGAERRAAAGSGLFMEVIDGTERVRIHVQPTAARVGRGRGDLFAVRSVGSYPTIRAGYSGSPIVDGDGPVGIVTQRLLAEPGAKGERATADTGESIAVRVDAVRHAMQAVASSSQAAQRQGGRAAIRVLKGETPDAAFGADQLVEAGGRNWKVTPVRREVRFVVAYDQPVPVRRVRVSMLKGSSNAILSMTLATTASADDIGWVQMNCRASDPDAAACSTFTTVRQLGIQIETASDIPIELRDFSIE